MIKVNFFLKLVRQVFFGFLKIFSIFAFIILVMETAPTSSFLFDGEISEANQFVTNTLAVGMRSDQPNFVISPLDLEPGKTITRDIYVVKEGLANMEYKSQFEILPGSDLDLCQALEVRVYQDGIDLKDAGYLDDLLVENTFFIASEHWYSYEITLPVGSLPDLQNKICNFNVITTSWQVGGAEGFGFHDVATLTSTIATDVWSPENLVVINEFIPNPMGDDNASKPGGEWVELYNNGDADFDLAGWALYDAYDTHEIIITISNSDNNGNPLDGGETVIPAHGYLVVYRNGDLDFALNNTGGDAVRLYNDPIATGILVDSYAYGGAATEGKSFARSPDGVGAFVDPVPTPGRANVVNQADLDPSIQAWRKDTNYLYLAILDGLNYENAQINVIYDRDEAGLQIQDGFGKAVVIDRNNLYLQDLYFGTESSGNFYPHYDINNIEVEVILSGVGIADRTLNFSL